ncbi:MAG TPA: MBL fold metallo-hydrolase [Chloroflexaceae bacterium]|nr:MBL fold metallo-hydrolase [Chloroflexaceae bacterium]
MAAREILPGVLELEAASGDNRLALYLLRGERTLLVDSGLHGAPDEAIFPALAAAGLPAALDMLLVSHADADHHGGNAGVLARSPSTLVMCHRLDRPRVASKERHLRERYTAAVAADDTPFAPELLEWLDAHIGPDAPVHLALGGGEELWLGPGQRWQVLHAPGHTDGHLALWSAEHGALIAQDAVLGGGVPDAAGRVVSPPPYFAVEAYLATIGRLRALSAGLVLTAHFPPVEGAAAVERFLAESERFVHELDRVTLEIVRGAGRALTLAEVCAAADRRLGPFPVAVQWVPPVRAHLERHAAAGRLLALRGTGPRAWTG